MNTNNDDIAVLMTERAVFARFLASPGYADDESMREAILGHPDLLTSRSMAKDILGALEMDDRPSYELREVVNRLGYLLGVFSSVVDQFDEYRMERAVRLGPAGLTPGGHEDGIRYFQAPIAKVPDHVAE